MRIIFIPFSYDKYILNSGSERIRCRWVAPYLGADIYDGTQSLDNYDVIIYQKVFISDFIKETVQKYQGKKLQIFDVCDPDFIFSHKKFGWMCKACDIVTTECTELAEEIKFQYGPKIEIHIIPDRLELSLFEGIQKVHEDKSPWLVWFGYANKFKENDMKSLMPAIDRLELPLIVISDKPTGCGRWKKWEENTWLQEIIRGDIVLNTRCKYQSKKETNKTITSWALGMPVAENIEDIKKLLDINERKKEAKYGLKEVKEKWNVSLSAKELSGIILDYETTKN